MELVRLRLDQAEGVLADAKCLLDGNGTMNSVVNRAYYAMFYATLAALQSVGRAPRKHTGVISLFDTEFVLKGVFAKEMSADLHNVFEFRQESDYRTVKPMPRERAEVLYHKAVHFVHAVRNHLLSDMAG